MACKKKEVWHITPLDKLIQIIEDGCIKPSVDYHTEFIPERKGVIYASLDPTRWKGDFAIGLLVNPERVYVSDMYELDRDEVFKAEELGKKPSNYHDNYRRKLITLQAYLEILPGEQKKRAKERLYKDPEILVPMRGKSLALEGNLSRFASAYSGKIYSVDRFMRLSKIGKLQKEAHGELNK